MAFDRTGTKKEPARNPHRKCLQVLAYLLTEEMDNQEHLNKKKLAVKSPGRGMTVSFRRIIKSLKDIAASRQMTEHLQVIVEGHRHLLYQGMGIHSPNPLNC